MLKKNDKIWLPLGDKQLVLNAPTGAWLYLDSRLKDVVMSIEKAKSIEEVFDAFPDIEPSLIVELYHALCENDARIESTIQQRLKAKCSKVQPNFISLKIAKNCNLRCSYCYINADENNSNMMDEDTAIRIVDEVLKMHHDDKSRFSICFHGGEPLLNFGVIKKVTSYVEKYRDRISLSIQTNGILITDEIALFLKENNISVGVSLDGPCDLHNFSRHYANGKGSFDNVMKGIAILRKHDIEFGIISVMNGNVARRINEVIDFFVDNKIFSLSFSPLRRYGRGKDDSNIFLDDEVLFNAYKVILDRIVSHNATHDKSEWLNERILTNLIKSIYFNQKHFMCMSAPCGAGRRITGFDYNGDVYICDNFIDDKNFRVGSVYDGDLENMLLNSEARKKAASRYVENLARCKDCVWRGLCGGLCYASDYYSEANGKEETEVCLFYKRMIPYLIQKLDENPELPYLISPSIKRQPLRDVCISLDTNKDDVIDKEVFESILSIHNISNENSAVNLYINAVEQNSDLPYIVETLDKKHIAYNIYLKAGLNDITENYDTYCKYENIVANVNLCDEVETKASVEKFIECRRNKAEKIPLSISAYADSSNLFDIAECLRGNTLCDDKIIVSLHNETTETLNAVLDKMTLLGITNNIAINTKISEGQLQKRNYIYLMNALSSNHSYLWIDDNNLIGIELESIPMV